MQNFMTSCFYHFPFYFTQSCKSLCEFNRLFFVVAFTHFIQKFVVFLTILGLWVLSDLYEVTTKLFSLIFFSLFILRACEQWTKTPNDAIDACAKVICITKCVWQSICYSYIARQFVGEKERFSLGPCWFINLKWTLVGVCEMVIKC